MEFLSKLFDSTLLVVPMRTKHDPKGEVPLVGRNISVLPLRMPHGTGAVRKLSLIPWLVRNGRTIFRAVKQADAVHAPIPGDIGTLGIVAAFVLRKPLYVRHCGNWAVRRTAAEWCWRWFMERYAGGRNVMLATGGAPEPPSKRNANVSWIFSTSLTEAELQMLSETPKHRSGARLITVSRQEPGKGTDTLILSLPLIRRAFPDVMLDVVGDGSALPQLRTLATNIGMSRRVIFHGAVGHKEVLELLSRATLFCYPTSSEGFPKVVLEAMACGLPIVTTRVSVLTHLVSQGCGRLLEEKTPDAVARAVQDCLADRDAQLSMAVAALAIAREHSLERWRDTVGERLRMHWGPLASHV